MKKIYLILFLPLLIPQVRISDEFSVEKHCSVTYIANDGFLIDTGKNKILIDALFGNIDGNWCEQPSDSICKLMLNGISPFDNINLVLISHRHADHFSAPMVITFLKNNIKTSLICPRQVNELLQQQTGYNSVASRIISIDPGKSPDTLLSINNTAIRVMKFSHGKFMIADSITGELINIHGDVENLGFIIHSEGFALFHSGDNTSVDPDDYLLYNIKNTAIDIAFFDKMFIRQEGMHIVNTQIAPANMVFMHIGPEQTELLRSVTVGIPEIFIFTKSTETRIYHSGISE